jgi:hypothetical protein
MRTFCDGVVLARSKRRSEEKKKSKKNRLVSFSLLVPFRIRCLMFQLFSTTL